MKRPGRVIRIVERVVLGVGMGVVAWVVERRMVKAIKEKESERAGELLAAPNEVEDESGG